MMVDSEALLELGRHQKSSDRPAPQYHNPRLNRQYFSTVSQAEFSDVLNGKDFSIQAVSQPNVLILGRDGKDRSFDLHYTATISPSICSQIPLISEDDFVSLSLQALQGISSFLYNFESAQQKLLQKCDFILLGRSATSLSKYKFAFSEFFFIRLLLGSAQEAFSSLSVDRKYPILHICHFLYSLLHPSYFLIAS